MFLNYLVNCSKNELPFSITINVPTDFLSATATCATFNIQKTAALC